jgi:two-component system, response regulator PdtaR
MGEPDRPRRPLVLVVEDEPIVRMDLATSLDGAGFDVLEAANAHDAIAMLAAERRIQLVVTDIEIPGSMDGLALARMVRDRWPPVHIIAVSGRQTPQYGDLPERSVFFAKPYDVNRLVETARSCLS